MASTTWIGGGNNEASNPNDWSPTGTPQPGDTLTMSSGTMHVSGNDLAGDTLSVSGSVDIYTSAAARLDLQAGQFLGPLDVNVHGTLMLTASVGGSQGLPHLNVSGGTIHFIGSSQFDSTQVFDSNLVGSGTLNLSTGNVSGEDMEINGAVGRGLTFNLTTSGPSLGTLQIDHPNEFHGLINFNSPFGDIAFMGLQATSGDIRNDILQMFDGKKLVDLVRLTSNNDGLFKLEQNGLGVMLSQGSDANQPGGPGTILPLHIS